MPDISEITGGAGPSETAAITAVVAQLVDEARAAAARPPQSPRPSTWVQSTRHRDGRPLPSHVFDANPWDLELPIED